MASPIPPTMRAWHFTTASGGLEKNLFQPPSGAPVPTPTPDQLLIAVYSAAINPADYKVPELGLLAKAMVPSPSIPGFDFCGRVVKVGTKIQGRGFAEGDWVFGGCIGRLGKGSLAEYIAVGLDMVAKKPEGVEVDGAASCAVAGITAMQALQKNVREGGRVFVNGGSGGTGTWTIQMAKAMGCEVVATCSGANAELCRSLGAEEVVDYREQDVVEWLRKKGQVFDLVVDNVGTPANLYSACHEFLKEGGRFVQVGAPRGMAAGVEVFSRFVRPGFLGGGKRPFSMMMTRPSGENFALLAKWFEEGKVRAVIDSVFEFDDVPKAYEKLKTGRARGKIVIKVRKEE